MIKKNLYWSALDLQCCVSFKCIAKWYSYTYFFFNFAQLCLTLCDPMDYVVHGILQARIPEWVAFLFSRGFSQARDWIQVSLVAGRFLLAEPQGKPKNTGVGSLCLLQQIFQTEKLNWGLLHCRRILYQLSFEGNPRKWYMLTLIERKLTWLYYQTR